MSITKEPPQRFPTFSRLLSRDSRFRRISRIGGISALSAFAAYFSMALLTNASLALYLRVWETFEFITPSQLIVLPVSLLVSSIIGGFVGAQLGLSRLGRTVSVIVGLLLFYYVGVGDCLGWSITGWLPCPLGGWFEHSLAWENVTRAAYGENLQQAASSVSLALWAAVGLIIGMGYRIPEKLRIGRMFATLLGMIAAAALLLGTIFYPIAYVEKRDMDQFYQRINNLAEEIDRPSEPAKPTVDSREDKN